MRVVYERCCGLDVHKKTVVACVLITETSGEMQRHIRTFSTMTAGLLALADWLESMNVSVVAMESTGVYTPPPMLQIGGGTVRSRCWRDRTDAEDNTDLLLIYLNSFEPSARIMSRRV